MAFLCGIIASKGLLVAPVRGNAVLCNPVHLLGANLDLHGNAIGAQHHSVQRLVAIVLLVADIVLEPPLHWRPQPVHLRWQVNYEQIRKTIACTCPMQSWQRCCCAA